MNKIWQNAKKYIEICYTSCLCTGILLLASCFFQFHWPNWILFPASLLIQSLLLVSGERGLRIQLLGGILAANLIPAFIKLYTGNLPGEYLIFLQIEISCLIMSMICYGMRHSIILKSLILFPQTAILVIYSIMGIELPKWGIWMILTCLLFGLAEIIEYKITEGRKNNIFYLFPVLMAATLALPFLPAPPTPMEWKLIRTAASSLNEGFTSLAVTIQYLFSQGSGTFSLGIAGFSSDGSLGGSLFSSDKSQLTVNNTLNYSPLYLTGSIFSSYTGSSWEQVTWEEMTAGSSQNPIPSVPPYLSQLDDIKSALSQSVFSQEEAASLLHSFSCTVTYKHIKTKSLFYTPAVKEITLLIPAKTIDKYDSLMLTKAKGLGFSYRFQGSEINYDHEMMIRLMRQEAWKRGFQPEDAKRERRRLIYENYTSLPDVLPERVRDLAGQITAGAETNYDKLKAIESYLHQYTYITDPPICPKEQDFTDFFLFDAQKGYCTYFATAMAVLARCEGIPTRYVEGFAVPESTGSTNREILLTGSSAHAWPEAYIDYIGWVPFEPTSSYYQGDSIWPIPKTDSLPSSESSPAPPDVPVPEPDMGRLAAPIQKTGPSMMHILSLIFGIFASFMIILLLMAICLRIRNFIRLKGFQSKTRYQQLTGLMDKIFRLGKLFGYEKEDSETLSSFENRCNTRLDTPQILLSQIYCEFAAIRYGSQPITNESFLLIETYLKALEKQYLESCGLLKRLIYYLS